MNTRNENDHLSPELTLLAAAAGLVAGLLTAVAAAAAEPSSVPRPVPRPRPDAGGPVRELTPRQVDSHLDRARQHVAADRPARAVYHLRRHLDTSPGDVEGRALLAGTYAKLGLARSALSQLHLVLASRPDEPTALVTLASVQARLGKRSDALSTIERIRTLGVGDASLDGLEGKLLFRLGRHVEATALLASALATAPEDLSLLQIQGLNALKLGRDDDLRVAREAFERALGLAPGDASIHNNLGFAHERLGEVEKAYLAYLEADGLSQGDPRYAGNRRRLALVIAKRWPGAS